MRRFLHIAARREFFRKGGRITFLDSSPKTAFKQTLVIIDPNPDNVDPAQRVFVDVDYKLGSASISSPWSATIEFSDDAGSTWTYSPMSGAAQQRVMRQRAMIARSQTFAGVSAETSQSALTARSLLPFAFDDNRMATLRMLFHHPKMTKPENNFTRAEELGSGSMVPNLSGSYFVITSKQSRPFHLFGTSKERMEAQQTINRKQCKPERIPLKSRSYVKLGQAAF